MKVRLDEGNYKSNKLYERLNRCLLLKIPSILVKTMLEPLMAIRSLKPGIPLALFAMQAVIHRGSSFI